MFLKYQRKFSVAGLLMSVAALSGAVWLQEMNDWFPCALCIIQRYGYWLTGLGFLGLMAGGRRVEVAHHQKGFVFLLGFVGLVALAGAIAAVYQVWVIAHPGQTCGVDPLQVKLNTLPWATWWPMMFEADGLCSEPYPPFLGLSLPAWSALCFIAQLGLVIAARRSFLKTRHVSLSAGL